jgi:multicomponent Na+:H+ antiporter subunit G
MIDGIGFVFVAIGLVFDLFGCIGMVRLPDMYLRLQAGTKCVTLGTCSILFGTFLITMPAGGSVKALLCMLFIVLTNPVAAHAIARGAHRAGIKRWEGTTVDQYAEDQLKEKAKNK